MGEPAAANAGPLIERLWALERETDLRGLMSLTRSSGDCPEQA